MMNIVPIIFLLCCFYAAESETYTCVSSCECTRDPTSEIQVSCRGRNLFEIPSAALAREAWGSSTIDFGMNELSSLPANLFREQTKLTTLILDHNDIEKVDAACFNVSGEYWSETVSPLVNIDLRENHLHFIPPCFGKTPSSVAQLRNLRKLLLGGNLIENTAHTNSLVGVPNVEELDLSRNRIAVLPDFFLKKLSRLLYLDVSFNEISVFPSSLFERMAKLLVVRATGNRLRSIPLSLPASLLELRLAENLIKNLTKDDVTSLRHLEKLEVLDLSGNAIEFISRGVFSRLADLKVLDLSQNLLESVSASTFDGMRNIEFLFLQNNPTLTFISSNTFTVLPRLDYLFLYGCGIRTLSVPEKGLGVRYLWLFGNPLNCNCRLISLSNYLKTSDVILDTELSEVHANTGNARADLAVQTKIRSIRVKIVPTVCVSPTNRHRTVVGKSVATIPLSRLTCPDEPVYVVISVFLGILCFGVSIPVVFCLVGAYLLILKIGRAKFGWKLKDDNE